MRNLSDHEIALLEDQGCQAEDWQRVLVSDDGFLAQRLRHVRFVGDVEIGDLTGEIAVEDGFARPCGIHHATLRDTRIGDHCLVDNVGGYVSRYDIGPHCFLSHIGTLSTQGLTAFGNGQPISVLNEGGPPNIILHHRLTAQTAQLMLHHEGVRRLYATDPDSRPLARRGTIGEGARIVGAREIINTRIGASAEIQYASRLSECTIAPGAFVGHDVALDGCIVAAGASVKDAVQAEHCFIGESVKMDKGFSAASSLCFAHSELLGGEACACFCGPFTVSHHKNTLLIGGAFAFYNAGSGTNFSNHAYKMGPIHSGTLLRGSKTASGAHILWPATIGQFSMVMGKVATHPDTSLLPLSYVFGDGERTVVVPGICLRSVGTWRDVHKWPRRDRRPPEAADLIHHGFPNPLLARQAQAGKQLLEQWLAAIPEDEEWLDMETFVIRRTAAVRGIQYYDLLLRLFGRPVDDGDEWADLCGLLAPQADIDRLLSDVDSGAIATIDDLCSVLKSLHDDYAPPSDERHLPSAADAPAADADDAADARRLWLRMVQADAEREFQLGDIDEDFLREFISGMDASPETPTLL